MRESISDAESGTPSVAPLDYHERIKPQKISQGSCKSPSDRLRLSSQSKQTLEALSYKMYRTIFLNGSSHPCAGLDPLGNRHRIMLAPGCPVRTKSPIGGSRQ
jgi:hypothetical protein